MLDSQRLNFLLLESFVLETKHFSMAFCRSSFGQFCSGIGFGQSRTDRIWTISNTLWSWDFNFCVKLILCPPAEEYLSLQREGYFFDHFGKTLSAAPSEALPMTLPPPLLFFLARYPLWWPRGGHRSVAARFGTIFGGRRCPGGVPIIIYVSVRWVSPFHHRSRWLGLGPKVTPSFLHRPRGSGRKGLSARSEWVSDPRRWGRGGPLNFWMSLWGAVEKGFGPNLLLCCVPSPPIN